MRDLYYEWQTAEGKTQSNCLDEFSNHHQKRSDPFFDVEDYKSLVGVANIFLKALFYDSKLDYLVPIINTQGEVRTFSFFLSR